MEQPTEATEIKSLEDFVSLANDGKFIHLDIDLDPDFPYQTGLGSPDTGLL